MPELSLSHTPPPAGPDLWIRRLKAGESLTAVLLSNELWGVHYHWNGRSSIPHTLPANECVGCRNQAPLKWHGYFHVLEFPSRRQVFLELTPYAYSLMESKSLLVSGWRGQRFLFKRGNGAQARLAVEFLGAPVPEIQLPAARTPEKELRALWGLRPAEESSPGTFPGVDVGHWQ